MKQNDIEKIREYVEDVVPAFTPCVATETNEKWIKMFGAKMGERRLDDDNLDNMCTLIGVKIETDKDKKEFMKNWMEIFTRVMNEYITDLKKAKSEEEKEKIRKHGVHRKIDSINDKKKKKK